MTSALSSHGTFMKMGDGGTPETFTTIAEVGDIDLPEIKLDTEDATSHDSGGWEESIGVLLSGGEPKFEINWIPTSPTHDETTGLLAAILNKTRKNWKIVLPNTVKTFAFTALLTSFKPKAPKKGKLTADITLKISGAVTIS
ncbi:MAG: phage tail tube protein [Chloroflexota bacterium]